MFFFIRIFPIILIASLTNKSFAHDANMSTFQIKAINKQQWVYEVMTPWSNLDKSVRINNKDLVKADKNSVEYKQQIITYIKQGFDVKVTGSDKDNLPIISEKLSLGEGRIKIDEHVSIFSFIINGMPSNISQLDYRFTSMSETLIHNNIFRIIKGRKSKRYLLNKSNNFSGKVDKFFTSKNDNNTKNTMLKIIK